MSKSRKVIRRKAVKERAGLSYPQIWRKSADPDDDFPAAVRLGPSSIGWYEDEIDAWVKSRPRVGQGRDIHPGQPEPAAA
jgi:predicted DNA-binding transcriptional regulator AlpA